MKRNVIKLFIASFVVVTALACKNDKNKAETSDAETIEDVTEVTTTTYTVNTDASKIDWKGEKPTGTHTGYIMLNDGEVSLNDENRVVKGRFQMDMHSITVTDLEEGDGKENLEAHLKGTAEGKEGDFFNAPQYPVSTFEVSSVEEVDGKTMMTGNLTMKDVTKSVTFPVNVSIEGDKMILQSETFGIDRTEWNANFGSKSVFDNLGDKFINDTIELTIYVEAQKA